MKNLDSSGVYEIVGLPPNAFEKPPEKIEPRVMPKFSADPTKKIFVKSNFLPVGDNGNKVSFFERHPAHPNDGEAFISGAKPVLVALTPATTDALNNGLILPSSDAEATEFTNEKYKNARRLLANEKEIFRRRFVALVGSADGFEAAWNNSIRGRAALHLLENL